MSEETILKHFVTLSHLALSLLAAAILTMSVAAVANAATTGTGVISGTVFFDLNHNGVREISEPSATERIVALHQVQSDATRSLVSFANVGTDGTYLFKGLPFGDYVLQCDGCAAVQVTIGEGNAAVSIDLATPGYQIFLPISMR
ncbi:MAG: hypothetical protein D6706_21755 [Chloroflexi bacterium]|nr:MAG: hypothetical protein D6706_21755 [Chloroflexota bacterium]